jgi:FHA domain
MTASSRVLKVAVHLGDGVIIRREGIVACCPPGSEATRAAEALLTSVDGGQDLVTVAAELAPDSLSFGAVTISPGGTAMVVLVGHASATVDGDTVNGELGRAEVLRLPDGAVEVVLAGLGDRSGAGPGPWDFTAGVVPGRGVSVTLAEMPAAAASPEPEALAAVEAVAGEETTSEMPVIKADEPPPPAPIEPEPEPAPEPEPEPAAFESISLRPGDTAAREPLPVLGGEEPTGDEPASAAPDAPSSTTDVPGIRCSRGHFNDPRSRYCVICGISMLHLTHRLVHGPRPTLGFVVFDDGATYALDRSYLVGRDPDELVEDGAEPLAIDDLDRTVSRAHASIGLDGWDVTVTDLGSTNGSFVWDRATATWARLEANRPQRLEPGATVALGRRTFVFESALRTGAADARDASGPTAPPV